MDPGTVPRRTPAGDDAVARHAPELDTATRVVLTAIDGKRAYAALKLRFGALTDLPAALTRLVAAGMIEPLPGGTMAAPQPVAAPPATGAPAATTPAASPAAIDPQRLRQTMVRGLSEVLGPMGDALALKIERAKTAAELVELHARCVGVVRELRGAGDVERFLQWCPKPGE